MVAMIISFLVMAQCRTEKIHDFPCRQQSRTAQTRCCAAMRRVWPVCWGCRLYGSRRSTGKIHCSAASSRRSAAASANCAAATRRSHVSWLRSVAGKSCCTVRSRRRLTSSRCCAALGQSCAATTHCSTNSAVNTSIWSLKADCDRKKRN